MKYLQASLSGLSIITLPLGYFLTDNWVVTFTIWFIALLTIVLCGYPCAKYILAHKNDKTAQSYITFSTSILLLSLGLVIAAVIWSHLVTLDWGGILLIVWVFFGIAVAAILCLAALLALWIIKAISA